MHIVFLPKTGLNLDEVLERIVTDFKPPVGDENKTIKMFNI